MSPRAGRSDRRRGRRNATPARERVPLRRVVLVSLAAVGAGLAVVGGGVALHHMPTVPITSVRVAGELRAVTRQALEQAVVSELDGGFFGVNVAAVREAARTVPWVRDVTVRRVWPDSLHIAVIERVPVARWGSGGLLDRDGVLFTPVPDSVPGALVLLEGPQGTQGKVLARYRAFRQVLAPAGLEMTRVRLTERGAWHLVLDGGVSVLLGQGDAVESLGQFARAYPALLSGRVAEVEQVDLRYTNGFAVRWKRRAESSG